MIFANEEENLLDLEKSLSRSMHWSTKSRKLNIKKRKHQFFQPLAELAVDISNAACERELGKMDMYQASELICQRELKSVSLLTGILYAQRFLLTKPHPFSRDLTSTDLFLVSMGCIYYTKRNVTKEISLAIDVQIECCYHFIEELHIACEEQMLASKYLYDEGTADDVFNDEWAQVFNLDVTEVNELEAQFLTAVDWRLYVSDEEFANLVTLIEGELAAKMMEMRRADGPLSSQELALLFSRPRFLDLMRDALQIFLKTLLAMSALYVGLLVASGTLAIVMVHSTASPPKNNHSAILPVSPSLPYQRVILPRSTNSNMVPSVHRSMTNCKTKCCTNWPMRVIVT